MKKFRFAYSETSVGFIEVYAENEDDARWKVSCGEGDVFIKSAFADVGGLIESSEVE